jgi:hypothetical protein
VLLAVHAGAETFVDIARFGQKKIGLLRRLLPFRDGTPSHDRLGDFFATLDAIPASLRRLGRQADRGVVIAIDRKMLCGFSHKKGGKAAIHRVSALGIHFNAMTAAVRLIMAAKL